jgi:hypothetical protein
MPPHAVGGVALVLSKILIGQDQSTEAPPFNDRRTYRTATVDRGALVDLSPVVVAAIANNSARATARTRKNAC